MEGLFRGLRYSWRAILRTPSTTIVAALSLAIGIGANIGVFRLVDRLLLRSLPIRAPQEVVALSAETTNPTFTTPEFSYPDYFDYREGNQGFSGIIAFRTLRVNIGMDDFTERVVGTLVSSNYFDVLGVEAAIGRTFLPEEEDRTLPHRAVVISYRMWQRVLGSNPSVINQAITINEVKYTVVGVIRRDFTGTIVETPTDLWIPLSMNPEILTGSFDFNQRGKDWLQVWGRLKINISIEQAQSGMNVLASQVRAIAESPKGQGSSLAERRILIEPVARGISYVRNGLEKPLTLLMVIVGFILLIACANVANLLLARNAARRKENAICLALGATRFQIIVQPLTESLLIGLLGGGAGLLLSSWLTRSIVAFQPNIDLENTTLTEILDVRVLVFTILISVISGFITGSAAAVQSSKTDLTIALKGDAMGPTRNIRPLRMRYTLVALQIALSVIVVLGAALFIKSLRYLFTIDPALKAEDVLLVRVDLQAKNDIIRGRQLYLQLTNRLRTLPGVMGVSASTLVPMDGSVQKQAIMPESPDPTLNELIQIDTNSVGPEYHQVMGIPLIEGRGFIEEDRERMPNVAVINETMARLYFPNQNAVGKRLRVGKSDQFLEIIGVAQDRKYHDLREHPLPHFDLPLLQRPSMGPVTLYVRGVGQALNLLAAVRSEIRSSDPKITILETATLEDKVSKSIATERMITLLTTVFGMAALLIATIGVYALMAYSVRQRIQEIGIRMALGAQARDLLVLTLRQGAGTALTGVAIGLFASWALMRFVARFLFNVSPTDLVTFIFVPLLVTGVALLACYIPARRAMKLDPITVLRYE